MIELFLVCFGVIIAAAMILVIGGLIVEVRNLKRFCIHQSNLLTKHGDNVYNIAKVLAGHQALLSSITEVEAFDGEDNPASRGGIGFN